jgi:hypothetical protein
VWAPHVSGPTRQWLNGTENGTGECHWIWVRVLTPWLDDDRSWSSNVVGTDSTNKLLGNWANRWSTVTLRMLLGGVLDLFVSLPFCHFDIFLQRFCRSHVVLLNLPR